MNASAIELSRDGGFIFGRALRTPGLGAPDGPITLKVGPADIPRLTPATRHKAALIASGSLKQPGLDQRADSGRMNAENLGHFEDCHATQL